MTINEHAAYALCSGELPVTSGVARLGHTGAHALATRGCAPAVQVCIRIIGADSIVVDRESGAKWSQIEQSSIAMFIHRITSLVHSPYAREFAIIY